MKRNLFVLFCFIFNYFFASFAQAENSLIVVISEVAWSGTVASANDEWIEIYNNSDAEIDLSGWSLSATDGQPQINLSGKVASYDYFLLERTDDTTVNDIKADQIYSGSLGNTGEKLTLKDKNNTIVDLVDCSGGWFAGDNTTKTSMERTNLSAAGSQSNWHNNDGVTKNGKDASNALLLATPRSINSIGTSPSGGESQNSSSSTVNIMPKASSTSQTRIKFGGVAINELLVDPGDGENEWVELFSNSENIIDLSDWTIEDGSGTKTLLSGLIGGSSEKFFVVDSPKGSLNNAGDRVILRDSFGVVIDTVSYGNWDDGNKNDNAPTAADSNTIARKADGLNSSNNKEDFIVTKTSTKNKENIIEADDGLKSFSDLIITEIFPNPIGEDTYNEYIEFYNQGHADINLLGWTIGDSGGRRYRVATSTLWLPADSYYVLYRPVSNFALDNSGEIFKLFPPDSEKAEQTIKYSQANEGEGFSYIQGVWEWSASTTPGRQNVLLNNNQTPIVRYNCPGRIFVGEHVGFDGSDTIDFDNDKLLFVWDFGDSYKSMFINPDHTFLQPGKYKIVLTVGDGQASSSKECNVDVDNQKPELYIKDSNENNLQKINIVLNEVLPNPKKGQSEWVEIKNLEKNRVNLFGWSLDDDIGGSHPYVFAENFWLEADGFKVINQKESGVSLNNNGDVVRLINPNDKVIDETKYIKSKADISWSRQPDGSYLWTEALTPNKNNVFSLPDNLIAATKKIKKVKINNNLTYQTASLEEIDNWQIGSRLSVRGTVTAEPGMLGSQVFYITGSPGLEIYNYKKDFPALEIGDFIEVNGEMTVVNDAKRLKTKQAADIKILEHHKLLSVPVCSCQQVDNYANGQLIQIQGEITDKKGSTIYVDDGTAEVPVYLKKSTGILPADIDEGETVTVSGLLFKNKTSQRLLPRKQSDIIVLSKNEDKQLQPKVLGEVSTSTDWKLPARDKKSELWHYLVILSVGLLFGLSWIFWKNRN